jgi:hypothetical protein
MSLHLRFGSLLFFGTCAAACGESHVGLPDAFVGVDAIATDAPSEPDAPAPGIDSGAGDRDSGVTCTRDSCGGRTCGRSDCGAACGECESGMSCDRFGACTGTPVGTPCVDAFGEVVAYGATGLAVCETDPALLARCTCSAGDWSACGPCMDVRLDGARGDRCATDAQCADGVPCHPSIHLCGESCNAGAPDTCPAGTRCGIPGDVAGACLPECTACGASCGASRTCRPTGGGNVCVPSGYGWAAPC